MHKGRGAVKRASVSRGKGLGLTRKPKIGVPRIGIPKRTKRVIGFT